MRHLKTAMGPRRVGPVELVYFAPHVLHEVSDALGLESLLSSEIAVSLEKYLNTPELPERELDVFALTLQSDGPGSDVGAANLDRYRFLLRELVADADLALASPVVYSASPSEASVLRFTPNLEFRIDYPWAIASSLNAALVTNLSEGMTVIVDTPVRGQSECVIEAIEGTSLLLAGLDPGTEGEESTIVYITGVLVADPLRVGRMRAFGNWRSIENGTAALQATADANTPAVALGAGAKGLVTLTGSDDVGTITLAVRGLQPNAKGEVIADVRFDAPYAALPMVFLYPANADARSLPVPYADTSVFGFRVLMPRGERSLTDSGVYAWSYKVLDRTPDSRGGRQAIVTEFNESLYRLLYTPEDPSLALKTLDETRQDHLAHPGRVSSVYDLALRGMRRCDITQVMNTLAIAHGAVLVFESPLGGAIAGVVDSSNAALDTQQGDRLLPTFAAVREMIRLSQSP